MENEKLISINPISLQKQSSKTDEAHFSMVTTTPKPMLPPQFISSSLPCSATSSPTKTGRNQCHPSSLPITSLSRLVRHKREHLRRSKSCGEGRSSAPSDELDLYPRKPSNAPPEKSENEGFEHGNYEVDDCNNIDSENFKCGALCLFLQGFTGKRKQMKSKLRKSNDENAGAISSSVSLEKFKCGSWSSSAILNIDEEEGEGDLDGSMQLYFDLPVELIRTYNGGSDTFSPVTAAFVFESNRHLKKNPSTKQLQLQEPARHVRFSASSLASSSSSSPRACITPRLCKARKDFYAYLEEAQKA